MVRRLPLAAANQEFLPARAADGRKGLPNQHRCTLGPRSFLPGGDCIESGPSIGACFVMFGR